MRTTQVFQFAVRFIAVFLLLITSVHLGAQVAELPYYSGFDNAAEQSGWQQYRQGYESSSEWSFGGGIAPVGFSLPTCLSHDYNVGGQESQTVIDWFVSPAIHFPSESKMELKLRVSGFSEPLEDNLEIWFGMVNQNPAFGSFVPLANLSEMAPSQTWLDTIVDIPYTANEGYIGIRYKTVGSNWKTYAIDDISITVNPLGIEDENATSEIRVTICPNPFDNQLRVQSEKNIQEITLMDANGRCVLSEKKSGKTFDFLSNNLASGVYFLRVTTDSGIHTVRVVK